MKITLEQKNKIAELKISGLAKKVLYEVAKTEYEEAQRIEQQTDTDALENYNKKHNTHFEMSCELVDNEAEFNEFLQLQQAEFDKLGIEHDINKVYTYNYLKNFITAEKNYLMVAVDYLRIFDMEEQAQEIEKVIKTYIPENYKNKLIALNNQFLGL